MDPAINDPSADLPPPPPPDEPPPTDVTEFAEDVAGGPVRPDEPPTITPPFEPPPFMPSDVDQSVRHGGAPGVRVKHMGFLTEPVRASSIPVLGGRVLPDEILISVRGVLTDRDTDPSARLHAVLELLAPWLPPPPPA